jgi:hypothetical protein
LTAHRPSVDDRPMSVSLTRPPVLAAATAAALALPAAGHAARVGGLPSCGTISTRSHVFFAGTYRVGANVRCVTARTVIRRFLGGRGTEHQGQTESQTYYTVSGWRCGYSTGSAGCTRAGGRIAAVHR